MKRVKVTLKDNTVKYLDLHRIDILPSFGDNKGPSMLHLSKRRDDKYVMSVTPDIIPDVSLLDKIEIVEE